MSRNDILNFISFDLRLLQIDLRDDRGLEVVGYLKLPISDEGLFPALVALGGTREFLASGSLFEVKMIPGWTTDFMLMTSAPGAFIILGLFLAGMNAMNMRKAKAKGKSYKAASLDCSSCNICDVGAEK